MDSTTPRIALEAVDSEIYARSDGMEANSDIDRATGTNGRARGSRKVSSADSEDNAADCSVGAKTPRQLERTVLIRSTENGDSFPPAKKSRVLVGSSRGMYHGIKKDKLRPAGK